MAERKENLVLFPFMAQGHIIPFLALALHLEQKTNYTITFVNTPLNIKKLRSSLPPNSSISLLEIPFCSSDHGLPSNTENTDALPYHLVIRLLEASVTSLKPGFKKLIENLTEEQHGQPPLCIIADIFFGWTASLAKELNVFHVIFSGAGGYGLACYYSLWVNLPHRKVNSDLFSLPDFPEASSIHITQLPTNIREADGTDSWSVFQKQNLAGWMNSDGILFNTVEELDHTGLLYFSRTLGRPAWPIGPVLLSMESRVLAGKGGIGRELCIEWLSTKPLNSVLYVSFGSMNTISASQMMQLAMGLEASGRNFAWVVRPPIGFDINSEFKTKEWLPEGFEERIKDSGRGLLVYNWAPQLEILTHKSVSAFLTHCGWNSVLEALTHGVPMIGWPMAAEQFFNVKLLEEKLGVCLEVARGKSSEVRHEDIAAKIELVMGETSGRGKDMRRQARQLMEIIRNAMKEKDGFKGSSVKAMEDFFSAAMSRREKTEMEKKKKELCRITVN